MKSAKSATSELVSFFRECYSLMKAKGIKELAFEKRGSKISIKRAVSAQVSVPSQAVRASSVSRAKPQKSALAPEPAQAKVLNTIKSPLAGVFYTAASPNSKPFISPPCNVSKGETLSIVEAMKVMNEIESPSNCRVLRIIAKNAELVQKDEDLFEIE
ncbi:MAG: acetyl-CoA carboxylase biotin carboxyl carrier protein subunit [Elusimicrobiota bacterium]|nr:acetyl-CoA carboxylase biotin carboxyl carrier protein subunit [Elusimicrobiota bacterium]